jgi:hypothetical protein
LPRENIFQTGDGAQGGSFSAAAGAEQTDNLMLSYIKAQVINDYLVIIATIDIVNFQQGCHLRPPDL